MKTDDHTLYTFGDFALDLDREALFENGTEIHLRPKCFTVLKLLVENQGTLVTKRQLHESAWPSSVVTDDSLAHCLIEIRRALGGHGHEMIRTIPRRGYVLEVPVIAGTRLAARDDAAPASIVRGQRGNGVTAAPVLVAVLGLMTVAGLLAQRFDFTASGETARDQERAQTPVDVFAPTPGIDADEHYRQGQYFYNRRAPGDLELAERAFKRVVELDSSNADGWAGLAGVYNIYYMHGNRPREQTLERLGEYTHRALSLEPENALVQARMANFYQRIGNRQLAEKYFSRALALEPDNPLLLSMRAGSLLFDARFDEAIELQRRAVNLDSLSATHRNNLIGFLLIAGSTSEAYEELEHFAALKPSDTAAIDNFLTEIFIAEGRYEEALPYALRHDDEQRRNSALAMVYHGLGRPEQAAAALEQLKASDAGVTPYLVAHVYAVRGDLDQSMRWLRLGVEHDRVSNLLMHEHWARKLLLLSPHLRALRDNERWRTMLALKPAQSGATERATAAVLKDR